MYKYNDLIFPTYQEGNARFFVLTGFALNGPVNTPFAIKEGVDPFHVLGETKIAENYLVAKKNGVTPLILRLNGSHGECIVSHESKGLPMFQFTTLEAKDECNGISIFVFPTHMIIKGLYGEHAYYFDDYNTAKDLALSIQEDLYYGNGEVDVQVLNNLPFEGICEESLEIEFQGADDGFNYVDPMPSAVEIMEEEEDEEEYSEEYGEGELPSDEYLGSEEDEGIELFAEGESNESEEVEEEDGKNENSSEEEEGVPSESGSEDDGEEEEGDGEASFTDTLIIEDDEDQVDEDKIQSQINLIKESFIEEDSEAYHNTSILDSFNVDTILFTDVPYEVAPKDLTKIFGTYAMNKTEEQKVFCSVVLGSKLLDGPRIVENDEGEEVDKFSEDMRVLLENAPSTLSSEEYLKHIEVVLGTQNHISLSHSTMSCAASYAATRFNLSLEESMTNKPLDSISSLYSNELFKNEVANLSSNGYICIVTSIRKNFTPYSSRNCFLDSKILSKPHYLRSIHNDIRKASLLFDKHLGSVFNDIDLQMALQELGQLLDSVEENNPFYREVTYELVEVDPEYLKLSISFYLFGEVERVRSSLSYNSSREVFVEWN